MSSLIQVPVPEEYVMEVYRFLSALERAGAGDSHRAAEPGPVTGWTRELVRRAVVESSAKMRRALALLADAGDIGLTTEELAVALNYERGAQAVAGMLGAAQRRCLSRYGVADLLWEATWEPFEPGPGGVSRIVLPPEIRQWVSEVGDEQ